MTNKKLLICTLLGASTLAIGAVVGVASSKKAGFRAYADPIQGEWHHYSQSNPTSSQKGVREYWVQCGGTYQFSAPSDVEIVDKGTAYDVSGFSANDERYIPYQMDEYHTDMSIYPFGAGMHDGTDYRNSRVTYGDGFFNCHLYGDVITWKIELPRINFKEYSHVTMKVVCPDWYQPNLFGPEADDLSYQTVYGGNKAEGKIELDYYNETLHMKFYSVEYADVLWFTKEFSDSNTINGLASAYFYVTDRWDRYLNISNITLGKHVDDGNGVCTSCHHVIGGRVLSDTLFVNALEPDSNPAAPAGFEKVTRQSAKHNDNSYLMSIDLTNYKKLYFAIYSPTNFRLFSGGGDNKAFWTNRWNQFYMENIEGTWHAYGKDPGEANYTELTGLNQSTQWKYMFSFIRIDFSTDVFNLYTTELVALPN